MSNLTYKDHFDTLDLILQVEAEEALKDPMKAIIGTKHRREKFVVKTPANEYLNDEARVRIILKQFW